MCIHLTTGTKEVTISIERTSRKITYWLGHSFHFCCCFSIVSTFVVSDKLLLTCLQGQTYENPMGQKSLRQLPILEMQTVLRESRVQTNYSS